MRFRLLRWVFNLLITVLSRRHIEGLEYLPAHGPYILVANHLSAVDVPLGYSVLGGPDITGWAADKYQRHPFFGLVIRLGGGVFIRRGEVDRRAMEAAVTWLRAGNAFALSPEGTRSRTGGLQRGKTGVAYLADQAQVPILPLGLIGTDKAFYHLLRFRRPCLVMRFGRPFRLPALDSRDRNASLRRNADEVMCRIAALLPPEYRGYYAGHTRLKELLDEQAGAQV